MEYGGLERPCIIANRVKSVASPEEIKKKKKKPNQGGHYSTLKFAFTLTSKKKNIEKPNN